MIQRIPLRNSIDPRSLGAAVASRQPLSFRATPPPAACGAETLAARHYWRGEAKVTLSSAGAEKRRKALSSDDAEGTLKTPSLVSRGFV